MPTRDFWMTVRHAFLIVIGAIEKMLVIEPTTAEMRDWYKSHRPKT